MSAVLRLKVTCNSVKHSTDGDGNKFQEELVFSAVYGRDGTANAQWCKWTPSANLSFSISNPNAFGKVLPGQFFYVDLIPTEKDSI